MLYTSVMTYRVKILPRNITLTVAPHQTILEAAMAQGFRFPYGCDAGSCYVCAGSLESGTLHITTNNKQIRANDNEADDVLFCLAQPQSDCSIYIEGVLAPGEHPMINASCQVTNITPMGNDTIEVVLRLPAGKKIDFHPGQYLQVILDKETECAFSIASIPNKERTLQLYIGFSDKDERSRRLREAFTVGNVVKTSLPHGNCYLKNTESTAPLFLVAGSTGISQIKSIAEQCVSAQNHRQIFIYWGTRTAGELFLNDFFLNMAKEHNNIHYTPVVSEPDATWKDRTGFVHKAMLDDHNISNDAEIILCGSPGMAYAVLDDLLATDIKEHQVQSDVFDYAPRNS
jgi:CDP-4-dehydro-6-deoxyglucose reductase